MLPGSTSANSSVHAVAVATGVPGVDVAGSDVAVDVTPPVLVGTGVSVIPSVGEDVGCPVLVAAGVLVAVTADVGVTVAVGPAGPQALISTVYEAQPRLGESSCTTTTTVCPAGRLTE